MMLNDREDRAPSSKYREAIEFARDAHKGDPAIFDKMLENPSLNGMQYCCADVLSPRVSSEVKGLASVSTSSTDISVLSNSGYNSNINDELSWVF